MPEDEVYGCTDVPRRNQSTDPTPFPEARVRWDTQSQKKLVRDIAADEPGQLADVDFTKYRRLLQTLIQCYLYNERCKRSKGHSKAQALTTKTIVQYLDDLQDETNSPAC